MTYKHRDIVIAYMDGKVIQTKISDLPTPHWADLDLIKGLVGIPHYFAENIEYRIKPKTETRWYRVWCNESGRCGVIHTAHAVDRYKETLVAEVEKGTVFVKWLSPWVEYTIEVEE